MATFTIELREVLTNIYGPDAVLYQELKYKESVYGKLPTVSNPTLMGLGTYPIFNEDYRAILNGKIIDEYYTREIGTETIDNWTLMIRRKMDQIMPYYNQLYLSEEIPYNALDTMNIHTVSKTDSVEDSTADAKTTSTSDSLSTSRAVQSSTPQTMLSGNEDYATSASDSKGDTKGTGVTDADSASNTTNNFNGDNLVTGYQAAASDLIMKYRASLINIDTSILLELQDCFMMLLNNGDAYTSQNNYYGWAY